MPSSKRVSGNFNFWTGASEDWQYFDSTSNSLVTVRRGNQDTVFQSANLVVYGNIVGLGGNIYANITGNIVLPSGLDYGILYKDPAGNAAVSSEFFIDEANHAASLTGNITVGGAGAGNVTANNISANRVTALFANLTSANIGTANITANGNITASYIRAQGYLNTSGANVLYGNSNVFAYLGSNSNIILTIGTGNVTTSGFITAGGNVTAGYFIGNGSQLTGLPASYSNANVAAYLPTYTGNLASLAGNVTTTANIQGAYILGNGALLTGIAVGTTYSNANVANYLPVYAGSALFSAMETDVANITGQAIFPNVANLTIPGGSSGQALVTDGTGNVTFQNISATPGNNPGSFQYNSNGTALYGADDFVYDTSNIAAPNIRISNISLNIFKGSGSTDDNQFSVRGNMALLTATVGNAEQLNTGVLSIGGLDKLNLDELLFSNQAGNIVVVSANNKQLTYSDTFANAYSNANVLALLSNFNGNVIPSANAVYSLGNVTNQWSNLWVANNTIYLGGVPLGITAGNLLTVNGQEVLSANSNTSIATSGNVSAGNISVSGRVTFGDATYQTTAWTGVANNYVALGTGAGGATQSQTAVAIGVNAGNVAQDYYTVAIGIAAGRDSQLAGAVAIGGEAGGNNQGTNSIAIGYRAGRVNQANNSIVLNSTGANLNNTTANSFVVAPVRNTTGNAGILQYNDGTKEVSYSTTISSNVTVNGTGGVKIPNNPAFRVYGTLGNNIAAGLTVTVTQGTVVDYNQGDYYNNATGLFTAPIAGIYQAAGTVRVGNTAGLNQAAILKNDTLSGANVIAFWEVTGNTTVGHMAVSGFANLAVGDTLSLKCIAGNINFDSNDSWGVTYLG